LVPGDTIMKERERGLEDRWVLAVSVEEGAAD
jgi:hypothetical protein